MLLNYRLKTANHLHPHHSHMVNPFHYQHVFSQGSIIAAHKFIYWRQTLRQHLGFICSLNKIRSVLFYSSPLLIWLKWKICTLMSPSVPSLLRWCHADMYTVKCGKYHLSPARAQTFVMFQWTHNPSLLEHQVIVLQMYVFCLSAANRRKLDSWRTKYSRE